MGQGKTMVRKTKIMQQKLKTKMKHAQTQKQQPNEAIYYATNTALKKKGIINPLLRRYFTT